MEKINSEHSILRYCDPGNNAPYDIQRRLKQVSGAPTSSGRTYLLKHYSGEVLTLRQAVKAFCCECCGDYSDGRHDCKNPLCSLYRFMPYGLGRKTKTRRSKKEIPENADR
jgi:hypothetical protein